MAMVGAELNLSAYLSQRTSCTPFSPEEKKNKKSSMHHGNHACKSKSNLAIWCMQSGNLARVRQNSRRHAAPYSFRPQHARRGVAYSPRGPGQPRVPSVAKSSPCLPPSFPSPRPTATRCPSGGRPPPRLAPWQQKDTQAYGPSRAIQNKKKQNKKKLKVKDRS